MNDAPNKQQPDNTEDVIFNTKDLINSLVYLLEENQYAKGRPYSKFNTQEFYFIAELIFKKPRGLLFHYIADYLMNKTSLRNLPMFNAPSIKKLRFIYCFVGSKSAADAARKVGFSPRTAKQQAYRILREIHGYKRPC